MLLRLRIVIATCLAIVLSSAAGAAEESAISAGGSSTPNHHDPQPPQPLTEEDDSDWDYLRQMYEPAEKRAYSYVSEFKRLPVYNFGLGKRSGGGSDSRLYSFGLGKRQKGLRQYSFGLGKRPSSSLYSFGLGKRSMDYFDSSDELPDELVDENETEIEDEDMGEEKRAGPRQYSFGLGKRLPQRGAYSFGLGKRAPRYSFGLGKRIPTNRQYSFGLGKREVAPDELAAVAAESAAAESTQHSIKRRSIGSAEQAEWADAEMPRHAPRQDEEFGRAGRRTYSFGLGKRLPSLYSFGVGKRSRR